ncbi:MAG: KH domain-containing protein [Patescibacteria group bacterium]|nr:KH domain-containing protein [Patescibacteria group bacterium]
MVKTDKKVKENLSTVEVAENVARDFLSRLGFEANVSVTEEDNSLLIKIDGDDLGILIGYHGETLQAIQLILSLAINQNLSGDWHRVLVDIGSWRGSREEALRQMAFRAVERARFSKEPVALPPMIPSERRVVHLALQEHPEVTSESEGEGANRRVVIRIK